MAFECLAQKPFGGGEVALLAEPELDRITIAVNGPVEISPLPTNLYEGLASRAGESHPRALPEPYVTWSRASASCLPVLFRCPLPKPDMTVSVSSGFPVLTDGRIAFGCCHCGYLRNHPSSTCGPSPCGRLSRPPTTTTAPSPWASRPVGDPVSVRVERDSAT